MLTVLSNSVSVFPGIEMFELINKDLSYSNFERMLFMLRCPKWRPLILNTLHAESFSGNSCSRILILEDVTAWCVSVFITWWNGRVFDNIEKSLLTINVLHLLQRPHSSIWFYCILLYFHVAFNTKKTSLVYFFNRAII